MGLLQPLQHAACRSGCQGTPQESRGKVVTFLLWLIFKDLEGTCPCWATPVKWYMSLCFVPMERRGVQLRDWWDKPSVPDPITLNKGCLSKEKENQRPPPSWGPAPGGSEVRTAYTLASVFLISVSTDLTYTHTYMLFLTSKNKLVGFFFPIGYTLWWNDFIYWLDFVSKHVEIFVWGLCIGIHQCAVQVGAVVHCSPRYWECWDPSAGPSTAQCTKHFLQPALSSPASC